MDHKYAYWCLWRCIFRGDFSNDAMIKETPFNDKTQNNTTLKSWIDGTDTTHL